MRFVQEDGKQVTKRFDKVEQTVRGTLAEAIAYFKAHPPKGEFVIVLAGKGLKSRNSEVGEEETEDE